VIDLRSDIYYQRQYAELYVNAGESVLEFEFKRGDFFFYNIALKRPIMTIGNRVIDEGYYDIETPYGYGGYVSNSEDPSFLKDAWDAYIQYCSDQKVIAEFIRFHPWSNVPLIFGEMLPFCMKDRQVCVVDVSKTKEERWAAYPGKVRNILRRSGEVCEVSLSDDISTFEALYTQTMEKNQASDFYYFTHEYYQNLLACPGVKLLTVSHDEIVIAAGFFMFSGELAHYHLSANHPDWSRLNGNYLLLDAAFDLAREKGCQSFHLGGGRTNQSDDNLFRFKKKFASELKDFYLGGIVFNHDKVNGYSDLWDQEYPSKPNHFFLKYRN
jgi:UDP-N-acetylbacillosamine alanyltransferase